MPKSKQHEINIAILDALGIEWRAKDVAGVTLRMRAGKFPTVTVHRHLTGEMPMREIAQRFVLTPVETVQTSKDAPK
jgi:hypothetical protein